MSSAAAQLFNSSSALGPLDPSSSEPAIEASSQNRGITTRDDADSHIGATKGRPGHSSPNHRSPAHAQDESVDYPPFSQMQQREATNHPQLLPSMNGHSQDASNHHSLTSSHDNGSRSSSSERPTYKTHNEPARNTPYYPPNHTIGDSSTGDNHYQNHTRNSTNATSRSKYGRSAADMQIFGTPQVGVIGQHKPREMIRLDRDYSAGEICQFWSGYPFELEGRITATQHLNVMNELNDILASAFNPYKSIFDNVLAVLTLYISTWLVSSHYDKEIARFDRAIEHANQTVYNPAGLHLLNPRKNAYLFLELEYY